MHSMSDSTEKADVSYGRSYIGKLVKKQKQDRKNRSRSCHLAQAIDIDV